MLKGRTDLAVEAVQTEAAGTLNGVEQTEALREGFLVTTVKITDPQAAQALGKPMGTYVTLELGPLTRREKDSFQRGARALAGAVAELAGLEEGDPVLVVGLGNRSITPDAVGPLAQEKILVTRHLVEQLPEQFGAFRPVAAVAGGVLGTTGVESGELTRGLVEKLAPACVIAIDALAARSLDRLCATVQLSDAGITPGSGVGNHRMALDRESLGVPVIAVGMPTVVDSATLALDILAEAGRDDLEPQALGGKGSDLFVTTRDIDQRVADGARVIAYGVNLALQTGLTVEDVELFLE